MNYDKFEHRILQIPLLVRLPDADPLVIFHNRYWGEIICPEPFVTIDGHKHEYIIVDEPAYGPTSGRLLILSQYPILYARIQDHMRTLAYSGVIVQGSPGIGKSLLLDYIRAFELSKSHPVVLHRFGETIIHMSSGVYLLPPGAESVFRAVEFGVFCLFPDGNLVDDDDSAAATLYSNNSALFPVYSASPSILRWQKWAKRRSPRTYIMHPSSAGELYALCRLHESKLREKTPQNLKAVQNAVSKAGRAIRDLLEYFLFGEAHFLHQLDRAIARLSVADLRTLTYSIYSYQPARISHILVATTRKEPPATPAHDFLEQSIVSAFVWKRIHLHFTTQPLDIRRDLYAELAETSTNSVMRGWIFKSWCHDVLSSGGTFKLLPMVKTGDLWLKGTDIATSEDLILPKRQLKFYGSSEELNLTGSDYYVPAEGINPAFDAFFIQEADVSTPPTGVVLQMTIASSYSMKASGLRLLRQRFSQMEQQFFVFVIPLGHAFQCPANMGHVYRFYTLEVDVHGEAGNDRSRRHDSARMFELEPGENEEEDDLIFEDGENDQEET